MSDDLPRKHYPLSAVEEALNEPVTVQQIVDYVAANALEQLRDTLLEEIHSLRARIEVLERAHGLIPGTSMHAAWKEGNE